MRISALAWVAVSICLAPSLAAGASGFACLFSAQWIKQYGDGDLKTAAASLAKTARDCPEALRGRNGSLVPHLIEDLQGPALRESRLTLMEALFDGGYRLPGDDEPGAWWRELVARRIEKQDVEGAKKVLEHIDDFPSLLGMRVDRRFDALRKEQPGKFDIKAAQARMLSTLRARVDAAPTSLGRRIDLAAGLLQTGNFAESISIVESAVIAGDKYFGDWKQAYPWSLLALGYSYVATGRYDDALKTLRRAHEISRNQPGHGIIAANFAIAQLRIGRPDEILATLDGIEDVGPEGELMAAGAIHGAHIQKGDKPRADKALQRVRELSGYRPLVFLVELLRAGKMEEAKRELIGRLRDPDRRIQALIEVQTYRHPPIPPGQRITRARMQELVAMPDVRKVILEVGRIESFDFPHP